MRNYANIAALLLAVIVAGNSYAWGQVEQTPENLLDENDIVEVEEEPIEEAVESPPSNVVDVNEENFRRSMELRDRNLQRSPDLTTGSYSRSTGQQALERLPEESQKHLREQLREVIVENGPWSPEDEGTEYPYVPSEQAEKNRSLKNREESAWGEMVSEYHEREAAIHANAARTQAATASAGTAGQNEQGESGQAQQGQEMAMGEGDETSDQESARAERAEALAEMLNASEAANPSAESQQTSPTQDGVEQNALELLTRRNQIPDQPSGDPSEAVPVSMEMTQATSQSATGETGEEAQDTSLDFSDDEVIAIEDLD